MSISLRLTGNDIELIPLKEKYSSVSEILSTFPSSSEAIKKIINESNNLKRPSVVEFFGEMLQSGFLNS